MHKEEDDEEEEGLRWSGRRKINERSVDKNQTMKMLFNEKKKEEEEKGADKQTNCEWPNGKNKAKIESVRRNKNKNKTNKKVTRNEGKE